MGVLDFFGAIILFSVLCCMIAVLMIGAFVLLGELITVFAIPPIGPLLIIFCVVMWAVLSSNKRFKD